VRLQSVQRHSPFEPFPERFYQDLWRERKYLLTATWSSLQSTSLDRLSLPNSSGGAENPMRVILVRIVDRETDRQGRIGRQGYLLPTRETFNSQPVS
jgi:hypothetical protein